MLLASHPSLPVKNVKDVVALARARDGRIEYGSVGLGTCNHFAGERLASMAGIRLVHVPYKGALPVMVDLTGGQIPLAFLALASALPQVKSGKLPALAITTPRRLSAMPDVPTIAEGGHPGFALSQWYGAFVPSVTAADVVARLNTEPVKIARSGDVRRSSLRQGAELLGTPPDDLSSIVAGEIKRYAKLVAAANVRLDRALARVTRTAGSGASSVRLRGRAG